MLPLNSKFYKSGNFYHFDRIFEILKFGEFSIFDYICTQIIRNMEILFASSKIRAVLTQGCKVRFEGISNIKGVRSSFNRIYTIMRLVTDVSQLRDFKQLECFETDSNSYIIRVSSKMDVGLMIKQESDGIHINNILPNHYGNNNEIARKLPATFSSWDNPQGRVDIAPDQAKRFCDTNSPPTIASVRDYQREAPCYRTDCSNIRNVFRHTSPVLDQCPDAI